MKERAHRLLNIYSGEGQQAFLFSLLAFVLSLAASLGLKLSDTLFLIHLSAEKLPLAYACTACSVIACACVLIYAFHHYSTSSVFIKVILFASAFYGLVAISMFSGLWQAHQWHWFLLKVCTQIISIEIISCFWAFLDQYYHFQDAKRLFTLFNSSIYFGIACTGVVIRTAVLEISQIFGLIFALMLCVLYLTKKIVTNCEAVPDDSEDEAVARQQQGSVKSFFKRFIRSKFTLFLMLGNLLLYLLMTTTEIGYLSSFQHYFGVDGNSSENTVASADLMRFYGTCLMAVGVCNLITGWFFYSRLILRFGITTLVLLTPLGFAITYAGWPFDKTLTFTLIGFFVVESLYPIIEDNNFNLLLNAVPLKLKSKVRVVIESFSEPIGMLLSSILLSVAFVSWKFLGLALSLCSLSVAFVLRYQYFKAIFLNLKDHALALHKTAHDWLTELTKREKRITDERLISLFHHKDPEFQKLACEALFASGKIELLKRALSNSKFLYDTTKIHFLTLVEKTPYRSEAFVIDAINRWQDESADIDLQAACDFYLAKLGLLHPEKAERNLASGHLLQKGAAIIALQHSFAHLSLQSIALNKTTAIEEVQKLLESENLDELSLGIALLGIEDSEQNREILIDYLSHPSLKIAKAAAAALAECLDTQSIRHATVLLAAVRERHDSGFRENCFQALSKIGHASLIRPMIAISSILKPNEARLLERAICSFGLKTVPALVGCLIDSELHDRSRIVAGKILAQLSLPQLNAHLYDVIKKEIERAYFYFYYGHTLPAEYQGHDLTLLKEGLLSSFQSVIDFIIHLLGASKWIEDCELIVFSLRSRSPKIRSQAIETLELCCERQIFRLLYPLIGDLPFKEKLSFCLKFAETGLDIVQVLEKLERTANTLDLILATTWKYRLDLPNWRAALRKQMVSSEEIFHHFAYELLET